MEEIVQDPIKVAELKAQALELPADKFGLTPLDLEKIVNFDNRTEVELYRLFIEDFGGIEGVASLLKSDVDHGLRMLHAKKAEKTGRSFSITSFKGKLGHRKKDDQRVTSLRELANPEEEIDPTKPIDIKAREEAFGKNLIPPPEPATIMQLIIENIKGDAIIQILLVGAVVILALGTAFDPSEGWHDGLGIFLAVVIVLSVTAGNDYSKDKKFKKLLLLQSDKKTKVVRGGKRDGISSWDLIVGDLVELNVGDEVPADGLFVKGDQLVIDESPLTGESLPVKKNAKSPFLFSGCQVGEGNAYMLVTAVGNKSSGGQIQEKLAEVQNSETPMQGKLAELAVFIGKLGVCAGVVTFLALGIRWAVNAARLSQEDNFKTSEQLKRLAEHFVLGITIVVVAVPEGLPLAVTISLAFSMFKMIREKCFVRYLDASETMGEATCICTDKTGTLTENRMTVVKCLFGNQILNGEGSGDPDSLVYSRSSLPPKMRQAVTEAVCINSTCFIKVKEESTTPIFVGNATEGALLVFAGRLGSDYEQLRSRVGKLENGIWHFNSDRKRMSSLIKVGDYTFSSRTQGKFRLHTMEPLNLSWTDAPKCWIPQAKTF